VKVAKFTDISSRLYKPQRQIDWYISVLNAIQLSSTAIGLFTAQISWGWRMTTTTFLRWACLTLNRLSVQNFPSPKNVVSEKGFYIWNVGFVTQEVTCNCAKRRISNVIYVKSVRTCWIRATLKIKETSGYATWFTAGGAIHIALRQVLQNRKLRHLWRHNLGSRWKLQRNGSREF